MSSDPHAVAALANSSHDDRPCWPELGDLPVRVVLLHEVEVVLRGLVLVGQLERVEGRLDVEVAGGGGRPRRYEVVVEVGAQQDHVGVPVGGRPSSSVSAMRFCGWPMNSRILMSLSCISATKFAQPVSPWRLVVVRVGDLEAELLRDLDRAGRFTRSTDGMATAMIPYLSIAVGEVALRPRCSGPWRSSSIGFGHRLHLEVGGAAARRHDVAGDVGQAAADPDVVGVLVEHRAAADQREVALAGLGDRGLVLGELGVEVGRARARGRGCRRARCTTSANATAVSYISSLRPWHGTPLSVIVPTLIVVVGDAGVGGAAGVAVLAHRLEVAEAAVVERGGASPPPLPPSSVVRLAAVVLGAAAAVVVARAGRGWRRAGVRAARRGLGCASRGSPWMQVVCRCVMDAVGGACGASVLSRLRRAGSPGWRPRRRSDGLAPPRVSSRTLAHRK